MQQSITVYDYMALSNPTKARQYLISHGCPPPKDVKQVATGLKIVARDGGVSELSNMFMELHPDVKGIMDMIGDNKGASLSCDGNSSCGCSKKYNSACGCSHNNADGSSPSGAEILANAINKANSANAQSPAPTPAPDASLVQQIKHHQYFTVGLTFIAVLGIAYMLGSKR